MIPVIIDWLKGKKTYIIMFAVIAKAVILDGWQNGDWALAQKEIAAALGLGSLRAAISKSAPNAG